MTKPPARRLRTALLAAAILAAGSTTTMAAGKAQTGGKPIVLVVGDRFATALADGLEADSSIAVSRTTGDAFGLTKPSFSESLPTIRGPPRPGRQARARRRDGGGPTTATP